MLPQVVDCPEDFQPETLPKAMRILALSDKTGLAQLIPSVVRMSGAKAVIAPIDHAIPVLPGLRSQMEQWLEEMNVSIVFPKPFGSLTETTYNYKSIMKSNTKEIIWEFSHYFGKPTFRVTVEERSVQDVEVMRDAAACGGDHEVATKLPGTKVGRAIDRAEILHHHYPCITSMNQDTDCHNSPVHVTGKFFKDALKEESKDHL